MKTWTSVCRLQGGSFRIFRLDTASLTALLHRFLLQKKCFENNTRILITSIVLFAQKKYLFSSNKLEKVNMFGYRMNVPFI